MEAVLKERLDSKVKEKLEDILFIVSWREIARGYFGKSSSWLYHKLDGIDGNGGVAGDIAFLRRTGLPLRGDGESQDQGDGSKELLHTFEIELISKIRKKIRFRTRRRRPRRKIPGTLPGTPPRKGAGPYSGKNSGR